MRRMIVLAASVATIMLAVASAASADPTGARSSIAFIAVCDNGFANGFHVNGGSGTPWGTSNSGSAAEWVAAHADGSTLVFHPQVFSLNWELTTPDDRQVISEGYNNDARSNATIETTCFVYSISYDGAGNELSIAGYVSGFFS